MTVLYAKCVITLCTCISFLINFYFFLNKHIFADQYLKFMFIFIGQCIEYLKN